MSTVEETTIVIPSSPVDIKKIRSVIKSISDSMTRQEAERDFQVEAVKALQTEFTIPAKHFKRMAREYHRQVFDKNANENENFVNFYESIILMNDNPVTDEEEDENEEV